jgi:predicted metal-dependent hydrolase
VDEIAYSVRASARAKRVHVTVDAVRGVQVVVPASTLRRGGPAGIANAERAAAAAVASLRPWIERRQAELERVRAVVRARDGSVPYLGHTLRLVPDPGRGQVRRAGETLLVPADEAARLPALERWYRRRARVEVASRLDAACAQAGTAYTKLMIRGQRTRWASCSATGAMSFNWRLLLAPEAVLEYVVWHEVCHLEVMDHSPRFWDLLATRLPDYRTHARWLRRHGPTLVLA